MITGSENGRETAKLNTVSLLDLRGNIYGNDRFGGKNYKKNIFGRKFVHFNLEKKTSRVFEFNLGIRFIFIGNTTILVT